MQSKETNAIMWGDIERYTDWVYVDKLDLMPMLNLVCYIQENDFSSRLFAYTSVTRLIVSIYNPIEHNTEALHIEYNQVLKNFSFTYYSKRFEKPFSRVYPEDVIENKFGAFIRLIRW
jgi:hypothetical protein